MQTSKIFICLLAISFIACKTPVNSQLLEGFWQATDDSHSQLRINANEMTFVYDGKADLPISYNFQEKCPAACNNADKSCIVIQENGSEACYAIMKADAQTLAMYYTNGNGQPLTFQKTEAFELPAPYLIDGNAATFIGITAGGKIADHSNYLKKTVIKSGEGDIDGYNIVTSHGKVLGQAFTANNPNLIDLLWITEPSAHTTRNSGIGTSFGQLLNVLYDNYEIHGSELEGRTTVRKGNISYLLDIYKSEYNLKKSDIPTNTKVKAILIHRPIYTLPVKTRCYVASTNTTNTYSLELADDGYQVSGYLTIQQPPYHTGMGKLVGNIQNNIITADYTFQIEGDTQTEELIFKLHGDKLYQAEGALIEKGGKSVLKDKTNLDFSTYFMPVDCNQIQEAIGWAKGE